MIPLLADYIRRRHRLEVLRRAAELPNGEQVVMVLTRNASQVPVWIVAAGVDLDGGRFLIPIPQTRLEADGPWSQFAATAAPKDVDALMASGRAWVEEAGGKVHYEPSGKTRT